MALRTRPSKRGCSSADPSTTRRAPITAKQVARELSPPQQSELIKKGIPGLDFLSETRRVYPAFRQASHVLGAVNVDNAGIAGIEAHIDQLYGLDVLHSTGLGRDTAMEPLALSINMRIQNVLHGELGEALERYQAVAAAGTVIDVHTGEVVGLVSLPDFDPNRPATMLEEGRFNRITAGKFEPASIFSPLPSQALSTLASCLSPIRWMRAHPFGSVGIPSRTIMASTATSRSRRYSPFPPTSAPSALPRRSGRRSSAPSWGAWASTRCPV